MNNNIYIPSSPELSNTIHAIWQTEGCPLFNTECILPKGVVEVIFNFSSGMPMTSQIGSRRYSLSKCFINGYNTVPVELQLPSHLSFLGVQFQPLAIKKLFRIPAAEFLDTVVDLTLLDKTIDSLWHQLAEQDSFDARIAVLSRWAERKNTGIDLREKLINNFLNSVARHDPGVKELAGDLCYSPRHLSRKIAEATGLNTEDILHYRKYLHSLQLMHYSYLSLTEIAHQSNFFDQSHFIRSFKTYTNRTPGEYRRSKSHLAGHIYQDVR